MKFKPTTKLDGYRLKLQSVQWLRLTLVLLRASLANLSLGASQNTDPAHLLHGKSKLREKLGLWGPDDVEHLGATAGGGDESIIGLEDRLVSEYVAVVVLVEALSSLGGIDGDELVGRALVVGAQSSLLSDESAVQVRIGTVHATGEVVDAGSHGLADCKSDGVSTCNVINITRSICERVWTKIRHKTPGTQWSVIGDGRHHSDVFLPDKTTMSDSDRPFLAKLLTRPLKLDLSLGRFELASVASDTTPSLRPKGTFHCGPPICIVNQEFSWSIWSDGKSFENRLSFS